MWNLQEWTLSWYTDWDCPVWKNRIHISSQLLFDRSLSGRNGTTVAIGCKNRLSSPSGLVSPSIYCNSYASPTLKGIWYSELWQIQTTADTTISIPLRTKRTLYVWNFLWPSILYIGSKLTSIALTSPGKHSNQSQPRSFEPSQCIFSSRVIHGDSHTMRAEPRQAIKRKHNKCSTHHCISLLLLQVNSSTTKKKNEIHMHIGPVLAEAILGLTSSTHTVAH